MMSTVGPRHRVPSGHRLVVGLGISGRAIVRHLTRLGLPFVVADSRETPPGVDDFRRAHPDVELLLGPLESLSMDQALEVVVSPGVDPRQPAFDAVRDRLVGEIELFVRARPESAALVAITGSNAKSTVTTLVGEMARAAGLDAGVGGNLGTPALDLLDGAHELYILELSSFQLETTRRLAATVACFLNLSEDHLDRHDGMKGYAAAKQRIFAGASHGVVNDEVAATWPSGDVAVSRFTTQAPRPGQWGLIRDGAGVWLAEGDERWIEASELRVEGLHNYANALAALAIGQRMGWPREAMLAALRAFPGLAHRVERVGERAGVRFINDSKGTNVGASLAAIEGIGPTLDGKLIWLGGGVGKGADFSALAPPLAAHARCALLFGRDAALLEAALQASLPCERLDTLEQALDRAVALAQPGDAVLLSPACASLDQFANYQVRGDAFRAWLMRRLDADREEK
ncbi:UDP-N-acetylmuramoyl-L-alanine--D-glutamate ligase [Halotalea alkalilenta]|nr:UDP-N-acetylmuramoyl-L-alanine--D-glutamate ligase [Halotalea alkalilenta]